MSDGANGSLNVTCVNNGETEVIVASAKRKAPSEKSRTFSSCQMSLPDVASLFIILYRYARVSGSGRGRVISNTTLLSATFASSYFALLILKSTRLSLFCVTSVTTPAFFAIMVSGMLSYISVRVWDIAGNVKRLQYNIVVRKSLFIVVLFLFVLLIILFHEAVGRI